MRIFKCYPKILVVCFVFILTACASTGLSQKERDDLYLKYVTDNKLEKLDKISPFRFHGWTSLDNKHLILTASINKPYFIRLKSHCVELKWSLAIAIHKSSSQTLYANHDAISPGKFPKQKCFIEEIYQITREQAEQIARLDDDAMKAKTG